MAINTTSTYEQQKYILQCLYARPHSTYLLCRARNLLSTRASSELRDKGFDIKTFYRKETDSSGLAHRVGVYVLHQNEVSQNYRYND
ncbi:transcriptional regulator [Haemophilus haemolyticus]|nr:helix-turn-helix domain-containing protein [Haemophilus haemolyticus]TPH02094.1 transcriptional regulator [Haemophilus haemolyticus]